MPEVIRKLLTGAKRDDEVYTILRVSVRTGVLTVEEATTLGTMNGIDYVNWHGDEIPGDRE